MIAALQVGLGLESAEFKKNADEAKRKAQELGQSFKNVEQQTKGYDDSLKSAGNSQKQFADQARNIGYQVQDFAVQVGSGQSALTALGQQLPQLLSGFGLVGVILGTLAAVAIPAFKAALVAMGVELRSLQQILEDVDNAGKAFTDMNDKAGMSLKELSEIYNEDAAPALQKLYEQMRNLSGMKFGDEIKSSAKALGDEYNKFFFGLIPKTAGWAASSLAKDLNVAEDEAGRLLNTLKGLESGSASIQSVRNYVTSLQIDLSKATDEGRKWFTQFMGFYTKATEATEKLTSAQSSAIREGRKNIESAGKAAQSYLENLNKEIRRLVEGEEMSSMFEARKAAGEAGVKKMTVLISLKLDKSTSDTIENVFDKIKSETEKAMGADRKELVKDFVDEVSSAGKKLAKDADEWAYWRKQVDGALSPLQILENRVQSLDEAFEKGFVNAKEYYMILGRAFEDYTKAMKPGKTDMELMLEDLRDGFKSLGAEIVGAFTSGRKASDAFKNVLSSLLQKFASRALNNLFDAIFPKSNASAGVLSSFFNMFRANGGPVNSGEPYIVGEKGPELFVPKASGTIVPNGMMAQAGSTVVNYNIQAIDVKSFEDRIMGSNRAVWAANAYAQKSLSPRGRA
jgi:hypothetical protein